MKSHAPILRRVRGAVSTRDLVPVLTHFHFYSGRVQGTNGFLTIDSELPGSKIEGTVPAERFLKVLDRCGDDVTITQDEHHLHIKSGKFKAKIALSRDPFPRAESIALPDVTRVHLPPALWKSIAAVEPFIGTDASRPWSCSILLRGPHAYATNNIVLVRSLFDPDLYEDGPDLLLPQFLVDEVTRLKEMPDAVYRSETALQLSYPAANGLPAFWIRSVTYNESWPPIEGMFATLPEACPPLPDGLRDAAETVAQFCPDQKMPVLRFLDGQVCTLDGDHTAAIEGFDTLPDAAFLAPNFLPVLAACSHIDFSPYPSPCPFYRNGAPGEYRLIEGLALGVRV